MLLQVETGSVRNVISTHFLSQGKSSQRFPSTVYMYIKYKTFPLNSVVAAYQRSFSAKMCDIERLLPI